MGGMDLPKHFRWVREEGKHGSSTSLLFFFVPRPSVRWVRKGGKLLMEVLGPRVTEVMVGGISINTCSCPYLK